MIAVIVVFTDDGSACILIGQTLHVGRVGPGSCGFTAQSEILLVDWLLPAQCTC